MYDLFNDGIRKENINKFYIINKERDYISEGQYGKLFKARSRETFDKVAIKIINKKKFLDSINIGKTENLRTDIEKEAIMLKMCCHPNIVKYIDCYEDDINFYIVMDYINGGELLDYINSHVEKFGRGFYEIHAQGVFSQILSAVEHFHAYLIAHRDLKLENILVQKSKRRGYDDKVIIIDFGLANFIKIDDRHNTYAGTANYLPPEIILKKSYQPMPVDIWNLGVILFCMISGYFPFGGENAEQMLTNIINYKVSYHNIQISNELKDLLNKIFKPATERITLEGIKNHPWMKDCITDCYLPKVKNPVNEIDFIITEKMISLGFSGQEVFDNVFNNKNTAVTYIYHNLYNKYNKKPSKNNGKATIKKTTSNPENNKLIKFEDSDDDIEELEPVLETIKINNNIDKLKKPRNRRKTSLDNIFSLNFKKLFKNTESSDSDESLDLSSPRNIISPREDLISPRDSYSSTDNICSPKKRKSPRKISPRFKKNQKKDIRNVF